MLNFPCTDDIISQSVHKVQTPCSGHVVLEDEVILRESHEAYGVISLPRESVFAHQFYIRWWCQSVFSTSLWWVLNTDGVLDGRPGEDHDEYSFV